MGKFGKIDALYAFSGINLCVESCGILLLNIVLSITK